MAAALFATPPDGTAAGGSSAAEAGARGPPAAPARAGSRPSAAAARGQPTAAAESEVESLMAATGADRGTAAAALEAAGGDVMHAAATVAQWRE